jgi:hypothetical protein
MRNIIIASLLLVVSNVASASNGRYVEVTKQIEASVQVTGSIAMDAVGNVVAHSIDHPEKLDAGALQLVEQTVPNWKFKPVVDNGVGRPVKARMTVFLVAKKLDPKHFSVRIRSVHFDDLAAVASDSVIPEKMAISKDLVEVLMVHQVEGTVYLAVRVGRDGHVAEAVAEQVNLRMIGTPAQMNKVRDVLAKPALKAASRWTFKPPTTGASAQDDSWTVVVPIQFLLDRKPVYGAWESYVPGPLNTVPWRTNGDAASASPEALAAGQATQLGLGPQLLTALAGE